MIGESLKCSFFFFNDTATTEIYTLSLHDALPIFGIRAALRQEFHSRRHDDPGLGHQLRGARALLRPVRIDRKSTRLNSSHGYISYAVFCLKKKKIDNHAHIPYTITSDSPHHTFYT